MKSFAALNLFNVSPSMIALLRSFAPLALLATVTLHVPAKTCEDLKKEITEKLDAKGVKNYTIDIVPNGDVKDGMKIIGSCDGGTKKLVYSRNK